MKLRITILKYHSRYLCQISLQIMLLPIQIPSTSPLGSLYSEGRFNRGFFALRFWGAFIWRGLFLEFYGNHSKTRKECINKTANTKGGTDGQT